MTWFTCCYPAGATVGDCPQADSPGVGLVLYLDAEDSVGNLGLWASFDDVDGIGYLAVGGRG